VQAKTGIKREADEGPLLGALLRLCHRAVVLRLDQGFRAAGLTPPQAVVTQPLWDEPRGLRLTDLARRAGITKQSMGELAAAMEKAGYIEGIADPSDARARLLRLTAKGRSAGRLARKLVREVELEWTEVVGPARIHALRDTLTTIASTLPR
jgi:DNA-binding MarR family transcriptional regulator